MNNDNINLKNRENKEVTLVFTPFSIEDNIDDKEVDRYKNQIFNLWKESAKNQNPNISYIDEILPTNTNPISLGQLCIITYLKKHNIKVNYIYGDYWIMKKNYTLEQFIEYIIDTSKNSCMIGFYSMTPTINVTLHLMKAIKSKLPNIVTVLGGPHGTYVDELTLNDNYFVDVVARSEGEKTILEIVNAIYEKNKDFSEVLGITYRENKIVKRNNDRDLINEQEIPTPYYSVLPRDFNCLLTVMYARGCPYSCKFCAEGNMWRHKLRYRNPQDVANEIKYINDNCIQRVIHVCDSEIDSIPSKLEELLDCIIRMNLDCKLTVNLRCDAFKRINKRIIDKMKKAGIVAYLIGSESASDQMLKIMGRNSTFLDFIKTIELLKNNDAGFIFPGVMVGFPGETVDTINITKKEFLSLLDNRMVDYFFPRVFIPYPGSQPYMNPEKYDIKVSLNFDDYVRYGVNQPFVSNLLSQEDLKCEMFKFYQEIVDHYKILKEKS